MAASSIADFRTLVGHIQQASHPDIRLALIRVAGEAKRKLESSAPESAEFFESLRQSLSKLKGNANADLRIGCLLDCANYFYVAGDVLKGAVAAREGIALATAVKNESLACKGYSFLGYLLADSGAVAEGIEAHVSAVGLATKLNDHERRAIAILNLGVALFYSAQYEQAISCFELAEELGEKYPEASQRVRLPSLSNKALCYLYTNRLDEGLAAAEKCLAESSPPKTGPEILARTIRECNYAQLLLEAGEIKAARNRLPIIKAFALKADTQKTVVMATIVEGLLEIHYGDSRKGIDLIREAREKAGDVSSLVQDALIALTKGYELLGQYKNALQCLQQLMKMCGAAHKERALLHLRGVLGKTPKTRRNQSDFGVLQHKEALLRAKVAEDQLAWAQIEMLERLAVTADLREEASGEHGYRVGKLSAALAEESGLDSETCFAIDLAARLHDIGKMGVPDHILFTSKELQEAERHFMRTHTEVGAELLAKSNIPHLRLAEEIALYHHEWWDGSGYPKKLAGKRIPIHARIVALADVFDALTHGRPYAEPWPVDRAIEEIASRRGTQFDPDLTDRFLRLVQRLRQEHKDLDEFLGRAARKSPFLQARRKIKLMLEHERDQERKATVPGNQTRH